MGLKKDSKQVYVYYQICPNCTLSWEPKLPMKVVLSVIQSTPKV